MKSYFEPELDIVRFVQQDVLKTSRYRPPRPPRDPEDEGYSDWIDPP